MALNSIFSKVSNNDNKDASLFDFQLQLILIYINSDILERQIQALRIFSDLQKNYRLNDSLVMALGLS